MFASSTTSRHPAARWMVPALVLLCGFIIGYIHHRWFYAMNFHADAAAMQVLGQAIVDQGSLLPTNFGYGNQLIMFRSSPFIALAIVAGASGYDAYIIGSALSIAFWMVVLYAMLATCTADRRLAFGATLLFIFPMGGWEYDYILGQQSHLSNVVMAACVALAVWLYSARAQARWLALAAALTLLMAAEAPIRALLVIVPVAMAAWLYFGKQRATRVLGMLMLALVLGVLANKGLMMARPLGLSLLESIVFRSTGDIIATLNQITQEILSAISSTDQYQGKNFKPQTALAYGACLAYLGAMCLFGAWRAGALFGRVQRFAGSASRAGAGSGAVQAEASAAAAAHDFPGAVALLGIITGTLAVAVLKPDTARHITWAVALIKLSAVLALVVAARAWFTSRAALVATLAVAALLASYWTALLVKTRGKAAQTVEQHNYPPFHAQIRHHAAQLKINHIYGGDFWRMMTLNSTIPGMYAGTLMMDGTTAIAPDLWLSRIDIFAAGGDVLYYLKGDKVDKIIESKLVASGGRMLAAANGESLWVGKRVWVHPSHAYAWKGCALLSKVGAPNAQCHMQQVPGAAYGYLTYGPYTELPSGTYTFQIDYAGNGAGSTAIGEWDVALTSGGKMAVLLDGRLMGSQNKSMRLSGSFTIARGGASNVEVRTLAFPNTALRIERISIATRR